LHGFVLSIILQIEFAKTCSNQLSCLTGTLQTYAEIISDEYLQYISKFVVGIGPGKDTIVPPDANNYLKLPTDLVSRAHAHNLQVISSIY